MIEPSPCPVCGYPGGFHDAGDEWTPRRCAQVPDRSRVRPGNKALRQALRRGARGMSADLVIIDEALDRARSVSAILAAAETRADELIKRHSQA